MKKLILIAALFVLCSLGAVAHAQQLDAAFGLEMTAFGPAVQLKFSFPKKSVARAPNWANVLAACKSSEIPVGPATCAAGTRSMIVATADTRMPVSSTRGML